MIFLSTYVYNQSGYSRGEVIGKVESGYVYDLRRGRLEYTKEVISKISNNYVYPCEGTGYGIPQFRCKNNYIYKSSSSDVNPIYCAENGYIYLYPKSNNQIVAQYTGYASEALLCYVSLKYYQKHSTSAPRFTSSSSSQNSPANQSTGNSGGSGCGAFFGFAGFFIFIGVLGFFFNYPELFCFVYLIPPIIYLLFSLKVCLFSKGEFKPSGLKAIVGFIIGAAIFFGICFVIAIFEGVVAQLTGVSSVSLGKQVLPGSSHFIISMVIGGIAHAIVVQCEDK